MTFILGLDIGYSNLKLVAGVAGATPHALLRPAGAAPVDRLPEQLGRDDPDTLRVLVDNEPYAAGLDPGRLQDWSRVLHADYPVTASYRALYYAALLLSEQEVISRVITGLPVDQYLDKTRRAALVSQLGGSHPITPRRQIKVLAVQVIPQPVGGYMDLIRQHPDPTVLEEARVLVLDPGFFSLDWVLVVGGEIRQRSSGTSHQATSVILEEADRLITQDHGGPIGRERLEQSLRQGKMQAVLYGQRIELRPYLEQAAQRTVPVALAALQAALRNAELEVDLLLLTGGGAGFFEAPARALFPRSQVNVASEPVFANARGFWYYGALNSTGESV